MKTEALGRIFMKLTICNDGRMTRSGLLDLLVHWRSMVAKRVGHHGKLQWTNFVSKLERLQKRMCRLKNISNEGTNMALLSNDMGDFSLCEAGDQ